MLRDDLPVRYDARGVGPSRTDYPVWRRSTNEGSVAARPAEPKFEAGPPSLPPAGPAPAQRRFNFLIVGLTILLASGLVGGLLIFSRSRPKRAAVASSEDPVKQVTGAYLAYSAAGVQELDQLALAPVQPYLTDTGVRQEQAILQNI